MTRRKNIVLRFYTGLNVFIAIYLLVFFAWHLSILRSVSGNVIVWFMLAWFLGIPLFAIFLWFFNRSVRKEYSDNEKVYLLISRVAVAFTWLCSCWYPLVMVTVLNPWFWPLTMLDGPDTRYSKNHFEQYIGFAPHASVSKIYYRNQSGMLDSRHQFRFVCSDPELLDRIITGRKLETKKNRHSTRGPKWWNIPHDNPDLQRFEFEVYDWYKYLWYEPNTKTVWYETGS